MTAAHIHTLPSATVLGLRLVLAWIDGDVDVDGAHATLADLHGDGVGADCPYCMAALAVALTGVAVRGFSELERAKAGDPEFPGAAAFIAGLLARQLDNPDEHFPTWALSTP